MKGDALCAGHTPEVLERGWQFLKVEIVLVTNGLDTGVYFGSFDSDVLPFIFDTGVELKRYIDRTWEGPSSRILEPYSRPNKRPPPRLFHVLRLNGNLLP